MGNRSNAAQGLGGDGGESRRRRHQPDLHGAPRFLRPARPSLRLSAIYVALGLLASAGGAQADTISAVYVFGDSSADVGTFGVDHRPTNMGPMWAETLTSRLGLADRPARAFPFYTPGVSGTVLPGTNYAEGGAQIVVPGQGSPTMADEVGYFVADRRQFAKTDLVLSWFTRNDITNAFFSGMPYDQKAYTSQYIGQIQRLRSLGARNIVAFGAEINLLPVQLLLDAGVPPPLLSQLQQATVATEAALWPLYKGAGVYVIDINRLGDAVIARPAAFGFRRTTDDYQGRGGPLLPDSAYPDDGNVFTADGHYTSAMQTVIADYTLAELRARDQFRQDALQASMMFRLLEDDVFEVLANDGRSRITSAGAPETGSSWRLFVRSVGARNRTPSSGGTDLSSKSDDWGFILGADWRNGANWLVGGQASLGRSVMTFAGGGGTSQSNYGLLTAFAEYRWSDQISAYVVSSFGGDRFSGIDRSANLGPDFETASGHTKGVYSSNRIGAAYDVDEDTLHLRVAGDLSYQRNRLDGYGEAPGLLSVAYGTLDIPSLLGTLDLRADYVGLGGGLRPAVRIGATIDADSKDITLTAGPTAAMLVPYATRRPYRETAYGEISLTAALDQSVFVDAAARYNAQFGAAKRADTESLQVTLHWHF